ncbi:MAG: hypothetical protein LBJ32_03135 [Oscillospiraceae bacterium]|nr:hypothetical protein [Oscillospiraceae bacterium]
MGISAGIGFVAGIFTNTCYRKFGNKNGSEDHAKSNTQQNNKDIKDLILYVAMILEGRGQMPPQEIIKSLKKIIGNSGQNLDECVEQIQISKEKFDKEMHGKTELLEQSKKENLELKEQIKNLIQQQNMKQGEDLEQSLEKLKQVKEENKQLKDQLSGKEQNFSSQNEKLIEDLQEKIVSLTNENQSLKEELSSKQAVFKEFEECCDNIRKGCTLAVKNRETQKKFYNFVIEYIEEYIEKLNNNNIKSLDKNIFIKNLELLKIIFSEIFSCESSLETAEIVFKYMTDEILYQNQVFSDQNLTEEFKIFISENDDYYISFTLDFLKNLLENNVTLKEIQKKFEFDEAVIKTEEFSLFMPEAKKIFFSRIKAKLISKFLKYPKGIDFQEEEEEEEDFQEEQ